MGTQPEDVGGAAVLDAGCGSGRFARIVGEHGASLTVGVDINEAVDEAYASCRSLANVEIVQGNLLAPPFRRGVFDLVWCSGVLHHTPDAAGGHRSLATLVRPGGTLYVWVYAKRFNPFRFVKTVLDAARVTRLPESALLRLSKAMSYPSLALLEGYRAVRTLPGLKPRTAWAERTVRPRSLRTIQLTWFDALSPEYDSRHTEREVIGWFTQAGFKRIEAIEEPKVGVRGIAAQTRDR
jgi:SAM-dependent methyltransferase